MMRRLPILALALVAIVALVLVAREPTTAETATFSTSASGWMPAAPNATGLTETWFCPGLPATGDGVEGTVVIANRADVPLEGSVLLFGEPGESRRLDLVVDDHATVRVDVDATLPGEFTAAVVEIDGGGAIVEQQSSHPEGDSVAPCANSTSDTWYFADGYTVDGSVDRILLTNPYDQTVVVNLEFATREGSRAPASYRGLTVPARSVRAIDLGAPGAGAQGEPILAVKVETALGRLVVGRAQQFAGGDRSGHQVTLGSPALREQWWFANGRKGLGISETYTIYNPTDDDVEVDPVLIGTPVDLDPIAVPARQVAVFSPGELADLPEGRHPAVFSTLGDPAIVVERVTTVTDGDDRTTTVVAGANQRQDGYIATRWHVPVGPDEPVEDALVVYNVDASPGLVTVSVVGSSGPVPIDGLTDVTVPPASVVTIDLVDPLVLGRELIVESGNRIFVERAFPAGRGDTRSGSWAVPAG